MRGISFLRTEERLCGRRQRSLAVRFPSLGLAFRSLATGRWSAHGPEPQYHMAWDLVGFRV